MMLRRIQPNRKEISCHLASQTMLKNVVAVLGGKVLAMWMVLKT
jgi:hypothetical protein